MLNTDEKNKTEDSIAPKQKIKDGPSKSSVILRHGSATPQLTTSQLKRESESYSVLAKSLQS